MKTLVVVDKKTRTVICVAFSFGKKHDFKLFKESGIHANKKIKYGTDTGFLGIDKIHKNSVLPRKKSKLKPLSKDDKAFNHNVSSERIGNENAIGFIKRFRIAAERYRNRRRRFGLRFTLIAGICNFELCVL